ncbi:MAG: YafY family transcriptional regulator [Clostridia bacterium]|nr:YafY family transcriptional regulator [Clostridia bacterium]
MKFRILIGMLLMLLARKSVTAKEFSDRFEISKRTVYRYIDELSFAGIPVFSCRGSSGGFAVADTYKLPCMFFSEKELATLTSLIASIKEQLGDSSELAAVFEKLTAGRGVDRTLNIVSSSLIVDGTGWNADKGFSKKLSVIGKAVENDKLLKILYRAPFESPTERVVEPHALALKNGVWYLYAYCRLREDFRLFKISRISHATVGGDFKKRNFDFRLKPIAEWGEDFERVTVTLEITEKVRAEVEEWLGVDSVFESDKKLIARATLPFNDMLVSEILKLGKNAKIIKPYKLKAEVLSCAKQILKLYEKPDRA